jgi:flagellar biosynthetic protein FliO
MDIVRQSLALAFVFALLWAALWLLRKKGPIRFRYPGSRAGRNTLESRAKLPLSAQHALHLVRIGERELVLAVHPAGVSVLCDLAPPSASGEEGIA